MPTISYFYGITIFMFPRGKEHNPPHIHASMQDKDAVFSIQSGEIIAGDLPPKARLMVKEFVLKYQTELLTMWESGEYEKLEPIP